MNNPSIRRIKISNENSHPRLSPGNFVMAVRKDGSLAVSPLAKKLSVETNRSYDDCLFTLSRAYDNFVARICDLLLETLPGRKNQIHLFDPLELARGVKQLAGGAAIVSMDPMLEGSPYGNSRLYGFGGIHKIGRTERPGMPPLVEQISAIRNAFRGREVVLVDDDIASGETMCRAIEALNELEIRKIIPQIQCDCSGEQRISNIPVQAVYCYHGPREQIDLCDPRDFVPGFGGLVVRVPGSEELGRVPYIMPFCSPGERASVVKPKYFSVEVLKANLHLFRQINAELNIAIRAIHMSEDLWPILRYFGLGLPEMEDVISWMMKELDQIWSYCLEVGAMQGKLARLSLPEKIVLLDVNGTLIEPDASSTDLEAGKLQELKAEIQQLQQLEIAVGLCSDSPLVSLSELASYIGITGPILAEMGSVISFFNNKEIIVQFEELDLVKNEIKRYAEELGYVQREDSFAPEFEKSGVRVAPDFANSEWSFGAGRLASISVFGPRELIVLLARHLRGYLDGAGFSASLDSSPQHNFLGIHPGQGLTRKAEILTRLAEFGKRCLMVGDAATDFVNVPLARTAFVGNAKVSEDMRNRAAYISQEDGLSGVIEILRMIDC